MKLTLLAILLFPLSLFAGPTLPASSQVVAFTADTVPTSTDPHIVFAPADPHFKDFHIGQTEFGRILDAYVIITSEQWAHFSHVMGGDRTGTATLRDGTVLRWIAKPGGLATLTYPDGTVLCLSASKPQ